MKAKLFRKIVELGVKDHMDADAQRNIILSNQVCLLLFCIPIFFISLTLINVGPESITLPLVIQPIIVLIPIYLNMAGFTIAGRLMVSWIVPLVVIAYSIFNKLQGLDLETTSYVGNRFYFVASSIIPFLVFSLGNKKLLLTALSVPLLLILSYDAIHNLFGIGYEQQNLPDKSYSMTTVRSVLSFMIVTLSASFLRKKVEKNERVNTKLIKNLASKNRKIEEQYEHISKQRDKLIHSQEELTTALETIQSQQEVLLGENKSMDYELSKKNKELNKSNQQLIKFNNELQQFSYTVSHNMRGPIASLIGLLRLFDKTDWNANDQEILTRLYKSVEQLDITVNDLSKIIDVRDEIFRIKQKVSLREEIDLVLNNYSREIGDRNIQVKLDIDTVPFFYSIKTMIHSILFNLVGNAIKYASSKRTPLIEITASQNNNIVKLQVTDNGQGIDLDLHHEDVFKLFKRFHSSTEGKGIGLYLVKLQTEILDGNISIESEPDTFTRFTIELPVAHKLDQQEVFSKNYCSIYYDAYLNTIYIKFKGAFNGDEYKEACRECYETFKRNRVPSVLINLRNTYIPNRDDQKWVLDQIIPKASESGLKHVVAVISDDEALGDQLDKIAHLMHKSGLTFESFTSLEAARSWIEQANAHEGSQVFPYNYS